MIHIYPAIMGITHKEIQKIRLLKGVVDRVHIDVMDNIFVPNSTHGSERIAECAQKEGFHVWVHLMVSDVAAFLKEYELPEETLVSFHLEASSEIFEAIKTIKEKKCMVGIAINPKTPLENVVPFLNVVDQVLVMSVNPGFSGQPFLLEAISKIDGLVRYRQELGANFRIAIDGGINRANIEELAKKGVDDFAASSGIFGQPDPVAAFCALESLAARGFKSI